MKRIHGINAKAWFYKMHWSFGRQDSGAPEILGAAACEHWIQMELYKVIAEHIEERPLTVYPEWRKVDIAILPVTKDRATRHGWDEPVATIELKNVYSHYSPSKRKAYIQRLINQVQNAKQQYHPVRSFGFLFGIHSFWHPYQQRKKTPKPLEDLRHSMRSCLWELRNSNMKLDHSGSIETILAERTLNIGGAEVTLGCVGQYFEIV